VELIVFDLDGTLVDSRRDIATSVNELLEQWGRPGLPAERIYGYIGNGVRALLARSLGETSPRELDRAVEAYLPLYRRHLLDTTRPYPGVRESLQALAAGRVLAVLTNKPRAESEALLSGLALRHFFRWVHGGEDFPERKPSPIGIHRLLERSGAPAERALMVGDSGVDVETARNAGIAMCLVNYRSSALPPGEVTALDPDLVVSDLKELVTFLSTPSWPQRLAARREKAPVRGAIRSEEARPE
jgi:phosphoglycolate phosphatase